MKTNLFLAGILFLALVACQKKENNTLEQVEFEQEFMDEHTAQNSLDWAGEYQGVLPCADCEGINITVVLNHEGTFYVKNEYLKNDNNKTLESNGLFSWDKTGFIITLEGGEEFRKSYKVVEGALIYLDENGEQITGDLADRYRLVKK